MQNFKNGYNCAQAVLLAFSDELEIDEKTLALISSSFGGGMGRMREVCGWRPALMRWKGCWIASQILQLWRLQCTDETNSGACRRRGLLPADALYRCLT